jgi:hypothetical protein
MKRLGRAAYWTIPSLLCLVIYWLGLKAWFFQDDFAWLGMQRLLYRPQDLWHVMFAPMAQGTIRPWSERGFFLLFYSLFGLDALPFRIWVFLTQFANLVLLSSVSWRITRSRAAGFLAPVLWMVNNALSSSMSWTSSYNQVLCAFFLLLAFRLFLKYVDTGERKYYVWQWIVFLLGFGALELNVVYPALTFSYALFCARKYLWATLPMFVASALYAIVHSLAAPGSKSGLYAMHWDTSILRTFGTYWRWVMGPERLGEIGYSTSWMMAAGTWALLSALLGFTIWKLYRGEWLAAFCVSWFAIVLSPLLPLRDHVSDYYNTIPAIGLAILGAWALVEAWKSGLAARIAAVLLAVVYLASNVTVTQAQTRWNFERSRKLRSLVRGVERAHELHPGKMILLKGIRSDLFWGGLLDRPFLLLGLPEVYLVPGSENDIEAHPDLGDPRDYVLSQPAALLALKTGRAVIYEASGEKLLNITDFYSKLALSTWKPELSQAVDAGEPLFGDQFGKEWYPIENGFRWMPQQATVRLGGPKTTGQKLHLSGFAPGELFQGGPIHLTVIADGEALSTFTLEAKDNEFDLTAEMPARSLGRIETLITLQTDRIYIPPGDGRKLSLAFGKFRIQ